MKEIPKAFFAAGVLILAVAVIPLALIARARAARSPRPRIHFVPDMDNQPKVKSQDGSPVFADGMGMRSPVKGAVPRGALREDAAYFYGRTGQGNDGWVGSSPVEITTALMVRGRERFNVFCAPCHGLAGQGDGMTARYARGNPQPEWVPPASLTDEVVTGRPAGHLYNTIAYGIRNMAGYGHQVPPGDRWAIVAYLRALQRSQNASIDDVPPEIRPELR